MQLSSLPGLAELGAGLLVRTLEQIKQGTASRTAQDDSHSSYAPMLSKEMSPMDWDRSAQQLHDQGAGAGSLALRNNGH